MPPAAIGTVNVREESHINGARINIERIEGNVVEMMDSASRFVVMYRAGRMGVPAAADMYRKVGTFFNEDSWASETAAIQLAMVKLDLTIVAILIDFEVVTYLYRGS